MPRLVLALYALYVLLAFGWRTWLQVRRTGSSGFKGISRAGGIESLGGILLVVSLGLGVLAPLAALGGQAPPLLDSRALAAAGLALYAAGLAITLVAQVQMGASWRIGVDPTERTGLITHGLYRLARNPIYTGMCAVAVGLALLVPNGFALLALATLVVGLEVQVRLLEEPHLIGKHGEAYSSWAARTGRFFPALGRLR